MIAKKLGGKRLGPRGEASADVIAPGLCVQCKHRQTLPGWLKKAMKQAIEAAKKEELPIAVIHQHLERHDDDLVIMRFRDFQRLYHGE